MVRALYKRPSPFQVPAAAAQAELGGRGLPGRASGDAELAAGVSVLGLRHVTESVESARNYFFS